jgi:outer membrane lipoprotein-sorting protein
LPRKKFIMRLRVLAGFLIIALFSSFSSSNPHEGMRILKEVFKKNKSVNSLQLTIVMKERIDNNFVCKKSDFKVVYNPQKIYLKQEYPNKNLEVLYVEGQNENKAMVSTKCFPWTVMKLDPIGNLMRRGQHQSIFKSGFNFFVSALEKICNKYDRDLDKMLQYEGIVNYEGIDCYKINVINTHFSFLPYKVNSGENMESISGKLGISDYMIFEKNPKIKSYDNIEPGTQLVIPSDYAKQITVFIDKQKMIPVGVKVFDDQGLFEEYTFVNVTINPVFTVQDFDISNPNYGFY